MSGFEDKYKVCLSFPDSQAKLNWVFKVYSFLWKSQKETYALVQWHKIRHRLFVSEPIRNVFYLQTAIFEIPT